MCEIGSHVSLFGSYPYQRMQYSVSPTSACGCLRDCYLDVVWSYQSHINPCPVLRPDVYRATTSLSFSFRLVLCLVAYAERSLSLQFKNLFLTDVSSLPLQRQVIHSHFELTGIIRDLGLLVVGEKYGVETMSRDFNSYTSCRPERQVYSRLLIYNPFVGYMWTIVCWWLWRTECRWECSRWWY